VGSVINEWQKVQLNKMPINNLADLLDVETGTYIKSYGSGSIATSSIRGASGGHTLVLWNGLPIHSPMLGLLDLALLPIASAESISLIKGGNSAMRGSGAIGGVINLDNKSDFSNQLGIRSGTGLGSFGYFGQQISIHLGNEKLQSLSKFSHQQAENDFYYFLAEGLPKRKQTNAELSQQYIGQDLYWKIDKRNQLDFHFWGQRTDSQIPPTNVQNRSEAHQEDRANRFLMEYKHIKEKVFWNVKLAIFDEHNNYFDELILLESRNHFRTHLAEVTGQWYWGKHELLIGNFHTKTRAWSPGYRENVPSEYKTALFSAWKYKDRNWNSQFSLRQEMVDGLFQPLVPSFGFDWSINPAFTLKGKVSRNYRLPTLNDRYWSPGGNPNLLAESGWSQELTLGQEIKEKNSIFDFSLTGFNRNIDNWILWSLQEGQSFWSANNITSVWSRGVESRFSAICKFNNVRYQWRLGYDYIRSTNEVELENPEMAVGDQLIYIPVHKAFSVFSLDWHNLHFAYRHHFTGEADGINDTLEAYHLGSVRLQYSIHFQTGINLSINKIR